MSEIVENIDVCNAALAAFGGGSITDFNEISDLAEMCRLIVPMHIDLCLQSQAWRMNAVTRQLQRITFTPEDPQPPNGFRYGFAYPAEALRGPFKVRNQRDVRGGLNRDFTTEGRRLYCDREQVFADFVIRLPPGQWGPTFQAFVIMAVAAELVVPVTHDTALAGEMRVLAWGPPSADKRGGLAAKVLAEDLQTHPGPEASGTDDPLTAAHHSGGDWLGSR